MPQIRVKSKSQLSLKYLWFLGYSFGYLVGLACEAISDGASLLAMAIIGETLVMVQIKQWQRGSEMRNGAPVVAVIGNFDGVHHGHQFLISQARMLADDLDLQLAVVTFTPHPRAFFRPQDPPFMLMDAVQKNRVLAECGADIIVHITFEDYLRSASPDEFVHEVLQPLHIVHLFAGEDFAFGKARAGSIETLRTLGKAFDMQVTGVPLERDQHQMVISSSRIRAALQAGQPDLAEQMLGRPYVISGVVQQGDQRGRTIGFATANLTLDHQLQPAFGVYAIEAYLEGASSSEPIFGVANIGQRPTVNNRGVLAEAHLFDFNADIYGQRLEIALKGFVRPERKFEGLDALKAQIADDAATAKTLLAQ